MTRPDNLLFDPDSFEDFAESCETILAIESAFLGHREEASALRVLIQKATVEAPSRRLVQVRAYLDRLEGIRDETNKLYVAATAIIHFVEHATHLARGRIVEKDQQGLVGRSMASEERLSVYLLRNRKWTSRASSATGTFAAMRECERYIREVIRYADAARLEALTMLRASETFSADEYNFYYDEVPSPATGE